MGIFIQFFDAVKRRKRRLQILSKHPRRGSFSAQLIALGFYPTTADGFVGRRFSSIGCSTRRLILELWNRSI